MDANISDQIQLTTFSSEPELNWIIDILRK